MLCQWRWLMQQSILQVLREMLWGVIHQAVAKGGNELVAGVVRTDDPLAHCQSLHGCGGHHITCAGVDEHLQP